MFEKIKDDLQAIYERDGEAESKFEVALCYPGFHAVQMHRLAHWCYIQGWTTTARFVSTLSRFITGIEIHPAAKIGQRVYLKHGMGIVIGASAVVGDDCTLYQGVMLGSSSNEGEKRHPTLGQGVTVGPGTQILGNLKIEDHLQIEANAIITKPGEIGGDVIGYTGLKAAKKETFSLAAPKKKNATKPTKKTAIKAKVTQSKKTATKKISTKTTKKAAKAKKPVVKKTTPRKALKPVKAPLKARKAGEK